MKTDQRTTPLLIVGLAVLAAGCNWLTGNADGHRPKQGIIVKVDQDRAALYVNEDLVGPLDKGRTMVVGLKPGRYRVVVKRPGYFSRYLDVQVKERKFERLEVVLRPELE